MDAGVVHVEESYESVGEGMDSLKDDAGYNFVLKPP